MGFPLIPFIPFIPVKKKAVQSVVCRVLDSGSSFHSARNDGDVGFYFDTPIPGYLDTDLPSACLRASVVKFTAFTGTTLPPDPRFSLCSL